MYSLRVWSSFWKITGLRAGWVCFSFVSDGFLIDLIAYFTLIETAQRWRRLKIDLLPLMTIYIYIYRIVAFGRVAVWWRYRIIRVLVSSWEATQPQNTPHVKICFLSEICTLLNILHHLPANISSHHLTQRCCLLWLHLLYPTLITPCGHTYGDPASCSKWRYKEPAMHLPAWLYLILDLAGLCCLVSVDMNLE